MIIWIKRPLANDYPKGPASCKWLSRGTGLLQKIIRINQIVLYFPFYSSANLLLASKKHHLFLQNIWSYSSNLWIKVQTRGPFWNDVFLLPISSNKMYDEVGLGFGTTVETYSWALFIALHFHWNIKRYEILFFYLFTDICPSCRMRIRSV